jgi:hypothetical protein
MWWCTSVVPATQEAEAEGYLKPQIPGPPGQHSKTLPQRKTKNQKPQLYVPEETPG